MPGRRSGKLRTVPVGILKLDGRRFVQASYGREAASPDARRFIAQPVITDSDHCESVHATQLPPEEAVAILRRALEPFGSPRLLAALIGPRARPLVCVLRRWRMRVNQTLEEYVDEAQRRPLFELPPT